MINQEDTSLFIGGKRVLVGKYLYVANETYVLSEHQDAQLPASKLPSNYFDAYKVTVPPTAIMPFNLAMDDLPVHTVSCAKTC